jgi:hypothetical protein
MIHASWLHDPTDWQVIIIAERDPITSTFGSFSVSQIGQLTSISHEWASAYHRDMGFHVYTYTAPDNWTAIEVPSVRDASQHAERAGTEVRISEGLTGKRLTLDEFKKKHPDA